MKKTDILRILLCFAVLAVCVRPLSLKAQSGSSNCRVTATAGETATPPPADTGEGEGPAEPGTTGEPETEPPKETGEPEETGQDEKTAPEEGGEPEPGETGAAPKPEGGKEPEAGEKQEPAGDPEKEPQEPESTPVPGEETGHPDTGGDALGEEEPAGTGVPVPGEPQGERDGCRSVIRWTLFTVPALCILAALSAAGAFRWLWMLLYFLLFKRKRVLFHGILTEEKSFFIRVRNAEESSGLVQDMIDNAGSFIKFKREVLQETAVTCIPRQSRMRISCYGYNGRKRIRETEAGEQRLFRILGKLEGTGEVEVRITCRGTGIDIPLVFRV